MKTIKLFIIAIAAGFSGLSVSAQMNMNMPTSRTETFSVRGNCEMCKTRIETAVREEGATSADWNLESKMLTVVFNPAKTSMEDLGKKLAAAGHDNQNFRASKEVYDALPECCKYERAPENITVYYTCPMHPEVHSDTPGKCPECGMTLVKKSTASTDKDLSRKKTDGMKMN